jgi:hypothetical protein
MSRWLELLRQAIAADPRGIAGVAEAIGVARATLSLVANDKYPAKTDKVAAKVLAVYDRLDCPHTGEALTRATCQLMATRAAPTSSPRDMRHWRACQTCPNKPASNHKE